MNHDKGQEHMRFQYEKDKGFRYDAWRIFVRDEDGVDEVYAVVYSEDDARRLVAAWNACIGIETIALEGDKPGWIQQACLSAFSQRDLLAAQNKALRESLERLLDWAAPIAGDNRNAAEAKEEEESVEQARALLKEVP